MINNKNILAIVPARGGSKGIPLKNLKKLGEYSLIARVGLTVKKIPEIDRVVVSTDNEKIAKEAEKFGISAPFKRPKSISGDYISDYDVLLHSLKSVEKIDKRKYDIILMLQPTSPLRKPLHIKNTLKMLIDNEFDSVWTVSETDSKHHPLKQLTIKNSMINYYDVEGPNIIARQQLKKTYHRNGIAYAMTRDCIVEQKSIRGKKNGALIVNEIHISIDTYWDLELAEFLLSKINNKT